MSVVSGHKGKLYIHDPVLHDWILIGEVEDWDISYVPGSFRIIPAGEDRG